MNDVTLGTEIKELKPGAAAPIPKIYTNAKIYYSLSSLSSKDMYEPSALNTY